MAVTTYKDKIRILKATCEFHLMMWDLTKDCVYYKSAVQCVEMAYEIFNAEHQETQTQLKLVA